MSQQQKLEKVLDYLLNEDSEQAAELLHQIIVEKSRTIYESIVEEEDDADEDNEELDEANEVGGDPDENFTDEIEADTDEVERDEQNDGEADADDDTDMEFDAEEEELSDEERLDDLESQLAELRAEFDALMDEEMLEPNHSDLVGDMDMDDDMDNDMRPVGEVASAMYEKKKDPKMKVAPQAKKEKKDKKVDEETQFLQKVADTGQKGKAGLVGTGKNTPHGAEQSQSPYTHIPPRKDYGGDPKNILGSKSTGGEYGKYHGDSAKDETPTDNVKIEPKKSSIKADTTPKYTGGKAAGEGFTKSPLTKKPQ